MASRTLSELCTILSDRGFPASLDGQDRSVCAVSTLKDAGPDDLSFLSNPKYLSALSETRAGAVIVGEGIDVPGGVSAIRCGDPYAAVTVAIITIHGHRQHPRWGVSDKAVIDPTAVIGDGANIAAGATIAAGASLGSNCTIYPGCYVGDGVELGDDCVLFPNAVIYDGCRLGRRCTIHAGTVIGQDGLGYAPIDGKWVKIPQVGHVVIGDDVEIGANCAIDRATIGATLIGSGTKFGNLNLVGHGTKIGDDCLLVGLIGLAGSVTVGKRVTLAGQVGSVGHVTIGDGASLGGRSAVLGDVPPNARYLGAPAQPIGDAMRSAVAVQKLPELLKRVRQLERELESLRDQPEISGAKEAT